MLTGIYYATVAMDDGTVQNVRAEQHNTHESEDSMKEKILRSFRAGKNPQRNPQVLTLVRERTPAEAKAEADAQARLDEARNILAKAKENQANQSSSPEQTHAEIIAAEADAAGVAPAGEASGGYATTDGRKPNAFQRAAALRQQQQAQPEQQQQ